MCVCSHAWFLADGVAKDSPAVASTTPNSPLPSPGTGNGVSAQPKKVRGVGFGDIFREGSVKLKVRLSNSDAEEKKAEKVSEWPSVHWRSVAVNRLTVAVRFIFQIQYSTRPVNGIVRSVGCITLSTALGHKLNLLIEFTYRASFNVKF